MYTVWESQLTKVVETEIAVEKIKCYENECTKVNQNHNVELQYTNLLRSNESRKNEKSCIIDDFKLKSELDTNKKEMMKFILKKKIICRRKETLKKDSEKYLVKEVKM